MTMMLGMHVEYKLHIGVPKCVNENNKMHNNL